MPEFDAVATIHWRVTAADKESANDLLQDTMYGLEGSFESSGVKALQFKDFDYQVFEPQKQTISIDTFGGQAPDLGKQLEKQMWDIGVSHMMHLAKPQ